MATSRKNLFSRLTSLFKTGPVVKRKIQNIKGSSAIQTSSAVDFFRKSSSNVYPNALNAYGNYDRLARLTEFSEMDSRSEIHQALNIYSEESMAPDEKGVSLHIYSENKNIQRLLEELFYDTLNFEFVGRSWVRNLVKYGDFFLFNDVSTTHGVINVHPIPVNEVTREEGYDPENPFAVRFRWETQANQILQNWQITHFRLMGNDAYSPYGCSILDGARSIWRRLILAEDSMLAYRVIRSPERRVFYIDVGNAPPDDVPNILESARASLKTQEVADKQQGRGDLRYNSYGVDIDYFIARRGSESTTVVETLPGGQNTTAIEDVQYLQSQLFAALGIPKPYLQFDENLGSKASLAQLDLRFSRTINQIQKVLITELNKIAAIHLYSNGYDGDDLVNFNLQLSNPSTIAIQQKLELWRMKFEIAGMKPEGMLDSKFIYKSIMDLTDDQIETIKKGQLEDAKTSQNLEDMGAEGGPTAGGGFGGGGSSSGLGEPGDLSFGDFGGEEGGGEEDLFGEEPKPGEEDLGGDEGEDEETEDIFAQDDSNEEKPLLKDQEEEDTIETSISEEEGFPVNKRSEISKNKHNLQRRRHMKGASQNMMPKLADMLSVNNDSFDDPQDRRNQHFLKSAFKENNDAPVLRKARIDKELRDSLQKSLKRNISINKDKLLSEIYFEESEEPVVLEENVDVDKEDNSDE